MAHGMFFCISTCAIVLCAGNEGNVPAYLSMFRPIGELSSEGGCGNTWGDWGSGALWGALGVTQPWGVTLGELGVSLAFGTFRLVGIG